MIEHNDEELNEEIIEDGDESVENYDLPYVIRKLTPLECYRPA